MLKSAVLRQSIKIASLSFALSFFFSLAADAATTRTFVVYFEHNSSGVTPEAQAVLSEITAYANKGNAKAISITGHTDTLGSRSANMALSRNRARMVTSTVKKSLPAIARHTYWRGENSPPYSTPDETREPLNRCVVVVVTNLN